MATIIATTPEGSETEEAAWSERRATLTENGVKYCFASYVDAHGIPKGKTVPIHHFERKAVARVWNAPIIPNTVPNKPIIGALLITVLTQLSRYSRSLITSRWKRSITN